MAQRQSDRPPARRSLRTAVVWEVLRAALDDRTAERPPEQADGPERADRSGALDVLDVLDVGGGTGGFAVPLAELGHRVTVVDPSPDALASLDRRAAEAGVTGRIRSLQGDVVGLPEVVAAHSVDVVLCHGVLEHVDDPAEAVAQLASAVRPGGLLSLLAAQRDAAVLARALAGHFGDAGRALADPLGRWGSDDPMPRRFAEAELLELLRGAGFAHRATHGIRVFSDLVSGALVDAEPRNGEALLALELAVASHPQFRAVATQLHLLAVRD